MEKLPPKKPKATQHLWQQTADFPDLSEAPLGLSPFVLLTAVDMALSSRLEELRSESLSLETTGTDKSRGGHGYFLLLGQSGPGISVSSFVWGMRNKKWGTGPPPTS